MITLDSSALPPISNRLDRDHEQVVTALRADRGPYVIPAGILGEAAFMIEQRLPPQALPPFLHDLASGGFRLDCGEDDFPRIGALVERYADLPLGFADAAVIACAERHGGRVLTLDRRHFGVVAREGRSTLAPE